MRFLFHPSAPRDLRHGVVVLFVLSGLSLTYGLLYSHVYSFKHPLGGGLPDVPTSADGLFFGLTAHAVMLWAWASALVWLGAPAGAARVRAVWARWTAAEAAHPWAWRTALAASAAYAGLRVWANVELADATLAMLTEGTATTPFQYRALVPFAVSRVVSLLPSGADGLWVWYGLVELGAAFAAWTAMRAFLGLDLGRREAASVGALAVFLPLALNLATPVRHNAFFFPWDTLSVAVFTSGLYLLRERRWGAYYLLFAIGTLNRETTCFLTLAFVLLAWGRLPLRTLAAHAGAQLVLWVVLKLALASAYAGNPTLQENSPAGLFVVPYLMNLGTLSTVPGLLRLSTAMGGLWLVPALLARRVESPELRRLLRVLPVFLVGMFVVGEMLEVRIYSEMIPLATAALLLALRSVVRQLAPPDLSLATAPTHAHDAQPTGWRRREAVPSTETDVLSSCERPFLSGGRSRWVRRRAVAARLTPHRS